MRGEMQTVPLKYVKCAISALFFPLHDTNFNECLNRCARGILKESTNKLFSESVCALML